MESLRKKVLQFFIEAGKETSPTSQTEAKQASSTKQKEIDFLP